GDCQFQPVERDDSDRADAGPPCGQRRPEFVKKETDRRKHANPGDNDPVHEAAFASTKACTAFATSPIVRNSIRGASTLSPCGRKRAPSLAWNGMLMPNFSSSSNTISMTSSASAPISSSFVSAVSFSTGILSVLAI